MAEENSGNGLFRNMGDLQKGNARKRDRRAKAFWPQAAILSVFNHIYDRVDYLDTEDNRHYYQISFNGLNFIAVLTHGDQDTKKIVQYGFICYFSGVSLSSSDIEQLNRNLHISIAELDEQQNIILFSFVEAQGQFDENRFSLLIQTWHRDIVMTFKWVVPERSLSTMMSGKALTYARDHADNQMAAENMAEENAGGGSMQKPAILSRFLGDKDAQRKLCPDCGGRGKTGLFSRSCINCYGTGLLI